MSRLPRARATDFGPALNSLVTSIQQTTSALGQLGAGAGQLASVLHSFLNLANSIGQATQTLSRQVQGVGRPSASLATAGAAAGAAAGGSEGPFSAVIRSLGNVTAAAAAAGVSLAALAATAVPGGFQVIGEVFQYLVATVGQALVPAFVVLMAGVLTVADALASALKPSTDAAQSGFETLIDSTVALVQGFRTAIDGIMIAVRVFQEGMRVGSSKIAEWLAKAGEATGILPEGTTANLAEDVQRDDQTTGARNRADILGRTQAIQKRGTEDTGGLRGAITGNIDSVLQAMGQAAGQKGGNVGYAGVGDIRQQIQTQSFQNDIQQRTFNLQMEQLAELRKITGAVKDQPAPGAGR